MRRRPIGSNLPPAGRKKPAPAPNPPARRSGRVIRLDHDPRIPAPAKRDEGGNKFGATACRLYGINFQSAKEARRYLLLLDEWKSGRITEPEVQPRYPIEIGGVAVRYPSGRQMVYTADFRYRDLATDKTVIEDVKSDATRRTRGYRMMRALMHTMGYEIIET